MVWWAHKVSLHFGETKKYFQAYDNHCSTSTPYIGYYLNLSRKHSLTEYAGACNMFRMRIRHGNACSTRVTHVVHARVSMARGSGSTRAICVEAFAEVTSHVPTALTSPLNPNVFRRPRYSGHLFPRKSPAALINKPLECKPEWLP